MRQFKNRPALVVLAALAIITIAAPVAYAVVDRVFLAIDPEQKPSDIELSVKTQLDSVGIPATVNAHKDQVGNVRVQIQTPDQHLGSNLDIAVPDETADHDLLIE